MALRQWPHLLLAKSKRLCEDRVSSRMRHQKKTVKLGRTADHRRALLANQVCALIEHQRIKTTLAKAKAVRPLAERMVTLGKNGSIHARRRALAVLRQKGIVKKLFDDIAQRSAERNGGYTRIVKLGARKSDSARMAFIEWVDAEHIAEEKPKKEKKAKRKEPEAESQQITPEAEQPTREEPKAEAPAPDTRGTHRATGRRTEAEKAALVRTKVRRQLKLTVAAFVSSSGSECAFSTVTRDEASKD
jgi:large subunit ribosomal protein L17